jgi:hypothetical protein
MSAVGLSEIKVENVMWYNGCVYFYLQSRRERHHHGKNEKTGSRVGHIASQGLKNPGSLTKPQIRTLAASALTQRPDRKPAPLGS